MESNVENGRRYWVDIAHVKLSLPAIVGGALTLVVLIIGGYLGLDERMETHVAREAQKRTAVVEGLKEKIKALEVANSTLSTKIGLDLITRREAEQYRGLILKQLDKMEMAVTEMAKNIQQIALDVAALKERASSRIP